MKTLSSNLWVKGKPLLPSSSDCAKLIRVKIPADEVHWRGTSHGTGTLSNPHPLASEQLPTAEISHARDIPLPPEPILAPHMFDFFASKHIVSILPCYDHSGVGSLSISWCAYQLEQCGEPYTFNLDLLVTLDHDAIHRQPLARHAKIKEQLDKIKSAKERYGESPSQKLECSDMTIKEAKDEFRICLDPSNTIKKSNERPQASNSHFRC